MKSTKGLPRKAILWIGAFLLVIFIRLFSSNKGRVEAFYTYGIYPFISKTLRLIFGWIPFSLGDILYITAGSWLLFKSIKNIRNLFKRGFNNHIFFKKLLSTLPILIFVYLIFNIFWGLNYDRQGIASQLELQNISYDTSDVKELQEILLQKVNASKNLLLEANVLYPEKKEIFRRAESCYDEAGKKYPFLQYKNLSVKSSMYGRAGNYLGFTGYYNPFTGEGQVNTSVPGFLQPYITTHEMAHQLGYAKENEANFVGYLAAVNSTDILFHYSAYLDLFMYANREVYYFDSVSSRQSRRLLNDGVRKDIEEWKKFNLAHQSFIEPAITWMYGRYLRLNQQPKGMHSYNEVISMLIAYYKKYGKI